MCNGYNFGGSNTSRDLFIFTSWLPERKKFKDVDDLEKLWERLVQGDKNRDVMVSISTGDLAAVAGDMIGGTTDDQGVFTDKISDKLGLVEHHAYAVLEFKEVEGKKFVLVLNPWGRFYWKGEYSFDDPYSWTPSLKQALGYDMLKKEDKGLFWMEFETMSRYFDVIEMNWNPSMLNYNLTAFG